MIKENDIVRCKIKLLRSVEEEDFLAIVESVEDFYNRKIYLCNSFYCFINDEMKTEQVKINASRLLRQEIQKISLNDLSKRQKEILFVYLSSSEHPV